MGEEKPEEELMGKRKPSPRLSATLVSCCYPYYGQETNLYTQLSVVLNFRTSDIFATLPFMLR